jgi:methionyl aminopeptidase
MRKRAYFVKNFRLMSIKNAQELAGIQRVSRAVALTLKQMRAFARPGMSTRTLDDYGAFLMQTYGVRPAPSLTYGFPGACCISLNEEIAHGIPSTECVLREGDLVNIDVSGELGGFWADNGGSFVLGRDLHGRQGLVDASRQVLDKAIAHIRAGVRLSEVGGLIESEAAHRGYRVIRNLGGHGVGRGLHEKPKFIPNYGDPTDRRRFRENQVVAVETFLAVRSSEAVSLPDGWTLVGNRGGAVVQHEHTVIVRRGVPEICTRMNGIWD